MAFIIDRYNKYDVWDREHATYIFEINQQKYAIMKVELEWGLPQLPERLDYERKLDMYFIYDSEEQAMEFVKQMKSLN